MTQVRTKGLLDNFDRKANFWEVNQQMCIIEPFKALFKADRSEDKNRSSKKMWFIAFCFDQSSSNLTRNQPLHDKLELFGEEFFDDKDFYKKNKDEIDPLVSAYINLCDTPAMKALRAWNEKIEERAAFIKDQRYTIDVAETLDKLLAATPKIYSDYTRILKEINSEDGEVEGNRGGGEASASDKGLM